MPIKFENGFRTMRKFQEALGLPAEFAMIGLHLDMNGDDAGVVTIRMILTTDQAAKIGPLLGKYRLEPIEGNS